MLSGYSYFVVGTKAGRCSVRLGADGDGSKRRAWRLLNTVEIFGESLVRGGPGNAEAGVAELGDTGKAIRFCHPFFLRCLLQEAESAGHFDAQAGGFAAGGSVIQNGNRV